VETAAVVDLVDESRKVVGDIGEGFVGQTASALSVFMKLSALALS